MLNIQNPLILFTLVFKGEKKIWWPQGLRAK